MFGLVSQKSSCMVITVALSVRHSVFFLYPSSHKINIKKWWLSILFQAYRQWVARNGEEKLLPGISLNHDQLFFLNYARIWCGTMRPEDALSKIRSSVHSLGPIRVLGPLSNSKDFSLSYNCPAGSRMNPEKKCSVWWKCRGWKSLIFYLKKYPLRTVSLL